MEPKGYRRSGTTTTTTASCINAVATVANNLSTSVATASSFTDNNFQRIMIATPHQWQRRIVPQRGYGVIFILVVALTLSCDASWIDPDTSRESQTTRALTRNDNREYRLVFSDEFNEPGRTFHDGTDPRWTAINKNDYTNKALHYYSHDNAQTTNGVLNITTNLKINDYRAFNETTKKFFADKKYVQSAMIQSWNKFCFTGGIIDFSAKLPGDPEKGGLWPALWMLGNLARASYVGSSDYVWPFSYNKCDASNRLSQEINACSRVNHYGLDSFTGRGAPEIDILESMQGDSSKLPNTFIKRPYQSTSFQVAPGVEIDRPVLGHRPHKGRWYENLEFSPTNLSDLNPFFYGVTLVHRPKFLTYQTDAISANLQLNKTHYTDQHIYRVEWEPPEKDGSGGHIKWYTDGVLIFGMQGSSLAFMQTEIPSEPMYVLMNTAVSSSWGFPTPCPENCACTCFECDNPACACALPSGYCGNFPAYMEIDYVRIYQAVNESKHILGCSPERRPTELFIKGHEKRYKAPGQKRPLESVVQGGGRCAKQSDCGSHTNMGSCSSTGVCICSEFYTGPHCLAHAGFYDFDTRKPESKFSLSNMIVPKSMTIITVLLVVAFALSLVGTKRAKSIQPKYQRVGDVRGVNGGDSNNGGTPFAPAMQPPYQNMTAASYVLPPQHKQDITYCVIDGRLVDDPKLQQS